MACLLLYACMPYHAVSSLLPQKIFYFPVISDPLVLKSYELAMDTDTFFSSKKKIMYMQYIVIVFLSCCFRNTGIYVFLCMIPFLMFLGRRYWKRALLLVMVPVLFESILTPYPGAGYRKRKFRGDPQRTYAADIPGNPGRGG